MKTALWWRSRPFSFELSGRKFDLADLPIEMPPAASARRRAANEGNKTPAPMQTKGWGLSGSLAELAEGQRAVELATGDHPYFLNMPIWRPPGFMTGKQLDDGFGNPGRFTYWYVPPKFRDVIGLKDGDLARILDTSPPHNLYTFARGLAKIAHCNAVMKHGLDGFRHLATPDIILGRYPNIAYFVGSDPTAPSPRYARGRQHSVGLGSITYTHTKFLTATIRLFADSGAGDKGMPFYTVIYGSEGRQRVFARPRLPRLPKKVLL
jgi:hypothetical protein